MIAIAPALLLALAAPATDAVATAPSVAVEQRKYFPKDADARAVLDGALAESAHSGRTAIIVFGADWCHDSRSLAEVLTSSAFTDEFGSRYSVTFVDVGKPQTGEGRNLDLVARFGVKRMKGTPAMFAISPQGERINSKKDAVSWRNAHSRGEAVILAWIRNLQDED